MASNKKNKLNKVHMVPEGESRNSESDHFLEARNFKPA